MGDVGGVLLHDVASTCGSGRSRSWGVVVIVVAVDWRGHASCKRIKDSVDEFCADMNDWSRNGWEGLVDGDWSCRGGGGSCGRLRVNLRLFIRRSCSRCCSRFSRGEVVVGVGVDSGTGLVGVGVVVGVLVVLVVCVHLGGGGCGGAVKRL